MASHQDRPPVDEGPIPFFGGSDDKDPFGSLQQTPASQSNHISPQKGQHAPQSENANAGDASALFGNASTEDHALFGQTSEPYQPSQPIQASPFDSQEYSGSNTASFFDQPASSSFFDTPTQNANVPSQPIYDYSQQHQGDQQVPDYAPNTQQNDYAQHEQAPFADQHYNQQYAYGQQYDPASANSHEAASSNYSYEPTNQYAPQQQVPPADQSYHHAYDQQYDPAASTFHEAASSTYSYEPTNQYAPQQHEQQATEPYAAPNHSSHDAADYSQQPSYDHSQQQQFDPNVHYYYDEAGQLHYYDPNTNQEYDFSQYDYSQQYQYDQTEAPAETTAESFDNAQPDHQEKPLEAADPFELHAGNRLEDTNATAQFEPQQEEPSTNSVPENQFEYQDAGHSFFDDTEQYNPDIQDKFVTESAPDTGDLDDLVLGGETQPELAPPPTATAPPKAPAPPKATSPSEATPPVVLEAPPKLSASSEAIPPAVVEAPPKASAPSEATPPAVVEAPLKAIAPSEVSPSPAVEAPFKVPAPSEVTPPSAVEPPLAVLDSLLPCPDPECEGENPPKAKFCCECGRQLAALSRAPTPAVAAQQPRRSYSVESSSYFPQTGPHNPPQSYVPALPSQHAARSASPLASVSTPHDPYNPQGYYGGESYDPYQQQQYGSSEAAHGQQYDQRYDEQYGQQYNEQYDQQYGQQYDQQYDEQYGDQQYNKQYDQQYDQSYDQQYGAYDMVEEETQAAPAIDDPLNRAHGCPIAVFGFGGKLCLMFPRNVQRYSAGYGGVGNQLAPIQKVMPGDITIKNLKGSLTNVDTTALSHLSNFVGPLLMDSKVGAKAKKKEAIKYVNERVEALKSQLQGLADDEPSKKKLEARSLLWRVVNAALEVEGPMVDNPKLDESIRNILFSTDVSVKEENFSSFTVPADGQQGPSSEQENYNTDVLDTLQGHLMRGDREAAVRYAVQEDLWAHALIISSCVNKDLWKEVVNGFVERELSSQPSANLQSGRVVQGDRQALRVLYALFSGQGANAISELLVSGHHGFNRPGSAAAPFLPNQAPTYDVEKLSHWQDTLALILANRTPRDFEAITALGDVLRDSGLDEASQICYLVSPQSSVHGGIDTPHVRLTLLGASSKQIMWHDLDAIHLTELWEFAVSSKQPSGSQGLPFLQGYKLVLAWILADYGYIVEAQRYCEAMAGILKANTKGSPYLHKHLLERLKELNELCEMSGHGAGADSATSWLKQKIPKPTLDSIWGSLEGKFNKFVSGEDLPSNEPEARKSTEIVGSTMPETTLPARSASAVDMRYHGGASADWSRRAATPQSGKYGAGGLRSTSPGHQFGFGGLQGFSSIKSDHEPVEEETVSLQTDSYRGTPENTYSYGQTPSKGVFSPFGQIQADTVDETQTESYQPYQPYGEESGGGGWWSGSANDIPDTGSNVESNQYAPAGNSYQPAQYEPQQQQSYEPTTTATNYNDDDDLGLGNSSSQPKHERVQTQDSTRTEPPSVVAPEKTASPSEENKEQEKQEGKGGWGLFSIFSRSNTATPEKKSVRANLGEESSFYYDAELKRWVNKKAGPDSTPATPTPPPPRANSAMSLSTPNAASPSPSAAPPKNAPSTPPMSRGPPQAAPPIGNMQRATSVPAQGPLSGVPSPSFSTPPPPSGAGAARKPGAGRKPMRSRYVDVFNQQQ